MTIGSWDMSHGGSERNEEMVRLVETRDVIIDQLKAKGVDKSKVGRPGEDWRFELSMGMSKSVVGACVIFLPADDTCRRGLQAGTEGRQRQRPGRNEVSPASLSTCRAPD